MNVIVTAIGSMSAECTVASLKTQGFGVVATDIYPKICHPIVRDCFAFVQVPFAITDAQLYVEALVSAGREYGCCAVIPMTDPEVDVLSSKRALLQDAGISVWLPPDDVICIARSKSAWSECLKDASAFKTIPSFCSFGDLVKEHHGAFVAKKENGRSSEGIFFSNTEECSFGDNLSGYVFQPFIRGDIVTIDFVRHPKSGRIVMVPRKERLRTKNGAGTVVEILNPDVVRDAVEEVIERLHLTGVMNCEFIRAPDGLYLMDINPRFSAGVSFSKLAGYDFVAADVACWMKDDISLLGRLNVGDVYVKRFADYRN